MCWDTGLGFVFILYLYGYPTLLNWYYFCLVYLQFSYIFMQTAWVLIKRNAEWKPLQFLAFAFVYRIFEKLKSFEPPVSPVFTVSYTGNTVL